VTTAWREFQRGTALINRAKDYGRVHPGATEKDTLTVLEEPATRNNLLYAGTGLFLAAWERELMARSSLRRETAPSTCPDSLWGARSLHVALPAATAGANRTA
jgi:hypothetical protein